MLRLNTFSMRNLLFYLLLAAFAIVLFYHLSGPPLEPFDDASYADISRNIAVIDDWMHLRWFGGVPFLEKPPVYFWITAALFKAQVPSEFGARLFPALCSIGLLAFVYGFARISARRFALVAPLLLLTVSQFWEYSSRAMLDVPITLFISIALGTFYIAEQKSNCRWYALYGGAVALAILTKSVVGLIPVIVSGSFLLVTSPRRILDRGYLMGTGMALALSAPWHLWMSRSYGVLFWREYIGYHVIARFTGNIAVNQGPTSSYAYYIFRQETMFAACAILAIIAGLYFVARNRDKFSGFLLMWAGLIFIVFSVSEGKLPWYILPLYPPLVIAFAYVIDTLTIDLPWTVVLALGMILTADAAIVSYRFHRDETARGTDANLTQQVRTISRKLREVTSPQQRISIFGLGNAVSPVSFYAERPVRFLFDDPATSAIYAKVPTNYESYGVVRAVPMTKAAVLVKEEGGILLLQRSAAAPLRGAAVVVAETRDLLALRFQP